MGIKYIDDLQSQALENYTCDNCEETALVLAGNFPACWAMIPELVGLGEIGKELWYCPECKVNRSGVIYG